MRSNDDDDDDNRDQKYILWKQLEKDQKYFWKSVILYPEIKIAFTLPSKYSSHWLTLNSEDRTLTNSMNSFLSQYKTDGNFEKRHNVYFQHLNVFNYVDILYYLKRIETKLPIYKNYFEKAAKENF